MPWSSTGGMSAPLGSPGAPLARWPPLPEPQGGLGVPLGSMPQGGAHGVGFSPGLPVGWALARSIHLERIAHDKTPCLPAYRLVLASFLWSFGGNLVYFFLNFHLEALGFGRQAIGLAQALLLFTGVVFALPLAYLIPRLGYLRSLHLAFLLAVGSGLLLGLGLLVFPSLAGYGLAGALLQGAAAPSWPGWCPRGGGWRFSACRRPSPRPAASFPPSWRDSSPSGWGPGGCSSSPSPFSSWRFPWFWACLRGRAGAPVSGPLRGVA